MVVKVYIASSSGSTSIKKQQQDVMGFLAANKIEFEECDIAANEDNRKWMRENVPEDSRPATGNPLPPQIFNEARYCGNYEAFFDAREDNAVVCVLRPDCSPGVKEAEALARAGTTVARKCLSQSLAPSLQEGTGLLHSQQSTPRSEVRNSNECDTASPHFVTVLLIGSVAGAAMLCEGFIRALTYRENSKDSAPASPQSRSPLCTDPTYKTKLDAMGLTLIKGKEEVPGIEQGLEQARPYQASPDVSIPRDKADQNLVLDLYCSWHWNSFCKDYPDLQLRGDHMVDRDSESLGPKYEICGTPLQSQGPGELNPLQPLGLPAALEPPQDDGYLVMDTSINLDKREPLSNSMLNCYLESKLLEVYRQHLQDSLARPGFPANPALLPSALLPSVDQLSQQLSLEQGLDASVARYVVTNYLSSMRACTGSSSSNSHFSSPVLRISTADERKKVPSLYQPL
ncbi:hypothetical protein SKAU_G00372910 [Synaphobranchus kaupii]|uniref:SH3 domain-binding glutamic acid-rich-like protein 1 n=1 Tax=Synaphobranchus kaupii TaxID=118154 RepID=A0A9Q1IF67_SYNKA|nr:hypothetical protein SKAU_G00372910 [Synaphobranchus kaupii]